MLSEEPRFTGSDVLRNGRQLAAVARIMRMQPDVVLWRVVVAARSQRTEELTRAKSQTQADAIRQALIAGGLPENLVGAICAVSPNQVIAIAAVERGDLEEEFVCPAQLQAQPREPSDGAASSSAPVPAMVPAGKPAPMPVAAVAADSDSDGIPDTINQCSGQGRDRQ